MNLCSILGERIEFLFPIRELGVQVELSAPCWLHVFEEKKLLARVGGKRIWILYKHDQAYRTSLLIPIITSLCKSDMCIAVL